MNLKSESCFSKNQPARSEERGTRRNSTCKGLEAERWGHVKVSEGRTLGGEGGKLKQSEGKEWYDKG